MVEHSWGLFITHNLTRRQKFKKNTAKAISNSAPSKSCSNYSIFNFYYKNGTKKFVLRRWPAWMERKWVWREKAERNGQEMLLELIVYVPTENCFNIYIWMSSGMKMWLQASHDINRLERPHVGKIFSFLIAGRNQLDADKRAKALKMPSWWLNRSFAFCVVCW